MAFHQQAADEVGGDDFGGAGEEGLGEDWEVLGGRGGYGSGLGGIRENKTPREIRRGGVHCKVKNYDLLAEQDWPHKNRIVFLKR